MPEKNSQKASFQKQASENNLASPITASSALSEQVGLFKRHGQLPPLRTSWPEPFSKAAQTTTIPSPLCPIAEILQPDSSAKHINHSVIINDNMSCSFLDLIENIQLQYSYWIPLTWPNPIEQSGPCCGLYALEIALKYAHPSKSVPPARKNGETQATSLRQIAKEKGYSAFGEIFNVEYLKWLALSFGFSTCSSLKFSPGSYQDYKTKLCTLLSKGQSLIVSCDLSNNTSTPDKTNGVNTHWALIFGYYYSDNECYFLVTQYGRFYAWSAKKLYEANLDLPYANPRCGPFYLFYKDKETKEESFFKFTKDLEPQVLREARYCKDYTLNNFKFTLLATPTLALKTCALITKKQLSRIAELEDDAAQIESPRGIKSNI